MRFVVELVTEEVILFTASSLGTTGGCTGGKPGRLPKLPLKDTRGWITVEGVVLEGPIGGVGKDPRKADRGSLDPVGKLDIVFSLILLDGFVTN